MIAAQLHRRRPKPHATWHLDEVYLKIDGRMAYLWRAVAWKSAPLFAWQRDDAAKRRGADPGLTSPSAEPIEHLIRP